MFTKKLRGRGKRGDIDHRIQTSSYQVDQFWKLNVQHDDNNQTLHT